MQIVIQSYDIPRLVSVYPDRDGYRWWTKAWMNNAKEGERSIEIQRIQAVKFIQNNIGKDEWMREYFPEAMKTYDKALDMTREQILAMNKPY